MVFHKSNRRIAALALIVLALDQFTKWLVLHSLGDYQEKIIVPGFFKFVHWGNTGAAWSLFSGNAGNLADRLIRHEVVDFLRFYIERRSGGEIGFPAFNIADTAICTGVGLIFLITWKNEHAPKSAKSSK